MRYRIVDISSITIKRGEYWRWGHSWNIRSWGAAAGCETAQITLPHLSLLPGDRPAHSHLAGPLTRAAHTLFKFSISERFLQSGQRCSVCANNVSLPSYTAAYLLWNGSRRRWVIRFLFLYCCFSLPRCICCLGCLTGCCLMADCCCCLRRFTRNLMCSLFSAGWFTETLCLI